MRPKPPAPLNLKLVPESLKFLFLKVYWNLPMSTPDEDVLAKVKAAAVGERSVFGALAGPGCDRLLLGQSELDAWTSLVIRVFDAHSSGR